VPLTCQEQDLSFFFEESEGCAVPEKTHTLELCYRGVLKRDIKHPTTNQLCPVESIVDFMNRSGDVYLLSVHYHCVFLISEKRVLI